MLAFCTSPGEIALVLEQSDARWLSEEMSFLSELYRSKAAASERQFGEDDNPASASFLETAGKCQQVSVALQQAIRRVHRHEDDGSDHNNRPEQPTNVLPVAGLPHPALTSPSPEISSGSAEGQTPPKRARRTAKARVSKKKRDKRRVPSRTARQGQ